MTSRPYNPHAELYRNIHALLRAESPYKHDPAVIDRCVHKVLGRKYPAAKKRGKLVRRIVSRIMREE